MNIPPYKAATGRNDNVRYPSIGLAEARDKREDAKKLIDNGFDPSELKKLQKIEKTK